MNTILEYLTEMYDQGREYSTINGHRSAISLYHPLIDGIQVGKHPTTRQLLKAISNKRPPQPRLAAVWDVQQVIKYIKAMPENTSLTTRQLAMKATILTALTCIPRASELHKLDTKYLEIKEDHLTFQIEGRVKHSRVGKKNPPLVLYRFQIDRHLCPVNTILFYLQATKEWRNSENTKVFLSNSQPHSQVCTATISSWIKEILSAAGIDMSMFTPHSTRSAASSHTKQKGLNRENILQMGNWRQKSTWEKFYHRQTQTEKKTQEFQTKVLS